MRRRATAITIAAVLLLGGCGGGDDGGRTSAATVTGGAATSAGGAGMGRLPPGAVGPAETAGQTAGGPAATEASPEAPAGGPSSTGELSGADGAVIASAVRSYVAALDHRSAGRVCTLIASGGIDLGELPRRRGSCRASLRASIGSRPRGGGPAWRRTQVFEVKAEALGDERARATATVTHHFSDRKYVSVEDDVIYLERIGRRWLLAKPSGTFYRAVGYPEPPLRALSPPAGW